MSRTITEQLPVMETGSSSTNLNPNVEDQIRNYRRISRARHEISRRLIRRRVQGRSLERRLNPEEQLAVSQQQRINLVPAEVLYNARWSEARHRVYEHYSDSRILCREGEQTDLRLITEQSYQAIRRAGMQHIHLGLIMIRVHALHRRRAGTTALIALRDTRWQDERQVIETMEVDLSEGTQLVYIVPEIFMSVDDFYNHIEIAIQTQGYAATWDGESNLLISRSLIGRLANTSYAGFRYNVRHVAEHLASNGIRAIAGSQVPAPQGDRWVLRPSRTIRPQAPTAVNIGSLTGGRVSLSFRDYNALPYPTINTEARPSLSTREHERDEEEFIGMAWEDDSYAQSCRELIARERLKEEQTRALQTQGSAAYKPSVGHFTRRKRTDWNQEEDRPDDGQKWVKHADNGRNAFMVKMTPPPISTEYVPASGWGDDEEPDSTQGDQYESDGPKWDSSPEEYNTETEDDND
ncbi:unnamed protein product [Rhodiola kirilowii]